MFSAFSRSQATSFSPLFVLPFLRHLISCVSVSPHPVRSVSFHTTQSAPGHVAETYQWGHHLGELKPTFLLTKCARVQRHVKWSVLDLTRFVLSCLPGRHSSIIIYSFLQKVFTTQGWTGKQIGHGSHPYRLLPVGTFLHHWHSPSSSFMIFHGFIPVKLSKVSF